MAGSLPADQVGPGSFDQPTYATLVTLTLYDYINMIVYQIQDYS